MQTSQGRKHAWLTQVQIPATGILSRHLRHREKKHGKMQTTASIAHRGATEFSEMRPDTSQHMLPCYPMLQHQEQSRPQLSICWAVLLLDLEQVLRRKNLEGAESLHGTTATEPKRTAALRA